jgi:hypothetical protein
MPAILVPVCLGHEQVSTSRIRQNLITDVLHHVCDVKIAVQGRFVLGDMHLFCETASFFMQQ